MASLPLNENIIIKSHIILTMTLNPKKLTYYEKKYERNPLEDTLKFMSNKWTLHVLRDLFLGKSHFNEFKVNRPSLDNKALSRCLKTMQENDLIYKKDDSLNTEYFLTEKGRSLNKVFYELLLFALDTDVDNDYYSEYEKKELKEMYLEILELK
ncbi:MAG: helix-turn-helix transcriptional regulator [Methanobrevibacter sp.]|nr:helix-turn-helix transcriptional regulator [Methanobrevibacter sp.]